MISLRENGDHGPWEKGGKSSFDLEVFRRPGRGRVSQTMLGGGPGRPFLIAALLLAFWTIWSAVYTVPSDSVAVIQRFGRYLKEVPPGLHLKLPLGVDTATLVPVKRQLKQEFGF